MAIVEKTIGNLQGKFDTEKNAWVEPPRVIEELPESVEINPLSILALQFLDDRAVIDAWIKLSPTIQAVLGPETRTLNFQEITVLMSVIEADREDPDNILSSNKDVANKLIDLLTTLRASVKNPNS